jgi:hypothetical protein
VSEKSLSQFFVWEAAGSANLRAVSGKVRSDHHCGAGEAKSMFMTKSKSRITPISIFPRRRGRSGEVPTLSLMEVMWCGKQRGINRHPSRMNLVDGARTEPNFRLKNYPLLDTVGPACQGLRTSHR